MTEMFREKNTVIRQTRREWQDKDFPLKNSVVGETQQDWQLCATSDSSGNGLQAVQCLVSELVAVSYPATISAASRIQSRLRYQRCQEPSVDIPSCDIPGQAPAAGAAEPEASLFHVPCSRFWLCFGRGCRPRKNIFLTLLACNDC